MWSAFDEVYKALVRVKVNELNCPDDVQPHNELLSKSQISLTHFSVDSLK